MTAMTPHCSVELERKNCENYFLDSCGLRGDLRGRLFWQPPIHVLPRYCPPAEASLDGIEEIEIATADGVTLGAIE
jgi:hypothetical protein